MSGPKYPNLCAALAAAQAMAAAVEKDAENKFHRYSYASAEAMIGEAKQSLGACGLAIVPIGFAIVDATAAFQPHAPAILHATWRVVHETGGALDMQIDWPIVPEKGRPGDKAVAAARTASLGYLLRDLLQLPRVEPGTDLDADERDVPREEPKRQPAPPKPLPVAKEPSPEEERAREESKAKLRDLREALKLAPSAQAASDAFERWAGINLSALTANSQEIARTFAAAVVARREGIALNPKQTKVEQTVASL